MKAKKQHIEQLRQELLAQDPSLAWEKEKYIWLLSRMDQHIPDVEQDPMFFWNLKNKLRYQLIGQHAPNPQPNAWQKFLLYGFPSLAIGLALIYILPLNPLQPTPTVSESASSSELTSWQVIQGDNNTEDIIYEDKVIQEKKTLPSPQSLQQPTKTNNKSSPELRTANMIEQDIDQESAALSYEDNSFKSSRKVEEQIRIEGYSKLTYILSYNDLWDLNISGTIYVPWCEIVYTLQDPISLSRWPNLRGITVISPDTTDIWKQYLTLTIENDSITDVEWIENLCK